MALKKPSDLFNQTEISGVFHAPEVSPHITESYDKFLNNFEKVDDISERLEIITKELSEKLSKSELEKAMLSQLMILDENFKSLQNQVRGINKQDLKEFKQNVFNLSEIVENLIEKEIPKYKKQITKNELFVGEQVNQLQEVVDNNITEIRQEIDYKLDNIAEVVDNNIEYFNQQLQETSSQVKKTTETYNNLSKILENKVLKENEKIKEYSEIVESLQQAFEELSVVLKEDILSSFETSEEKFKTYEEEFNTIKSNLEVSVDNRLEDYRKDLIDVKADVVVNEQHIKNVDKYIQEHHQELIGLKEEVFGEIEKLAVGNLQENLERLEKKIDYIRETYSKIEPDIIVNEVIKEGLLNEPPSSKNKDPLTPLDKKFVTLDQLQEHYRLFINRIQQQLSTLGGGGETQLKYLDDIVGIATNASAYDNKYLKYNHSLGKFEFTSVDVSNDSWADGDLGPYTLGDVGIGTSVPNSSLQVIGNASVSGLVTTNNLYVSGVGTFQSSGLKIRNPANTFEYSIVGAALTGDRTITIPLATSNTGIALTGVSNTFTVGQTFASTLTASGTLTLNGSSTGTNVFGTNSTTGTLTLGGTAQTGTIVFGRSTTTQQTDIQAGASGVGTTKTINFGTGGLSGSFTQINIGPTAGIGTVVINSGTNLGIGSTTPTVPLDVVGNVKITGVTTVGSLSIGSTQVISSARQLQNIASLDSVTTATIESAIANAPNTFTDLNVTGVSTFANNINLNASLLLPQNPNGVGFGTTTANPQYAIRQTMGDNDGWLIYGESPSGTNTGSLVLEVADDNDVNEKIILRNRRNYTGAVIGVTTFLELTNLGNIIPQVPLFIGAATSTGTASQRLQVTGGAYVSGSVGIGTTNPGTNALLHISKASGFNILQQDSGSVGNYFYADSAGLGFVGTRTNHPFIIGTNNTERVRIDNAGLVGIGTTNPAETLHLLSSSGRGRFQNSVANFSVLIDPFLNGPRVSFGSNGDNSFIEFGAYNNINNLDTKARDLKIFSTAAPDAFILRQSTGNIGIATTNPQYKLEVLGSFAATTKSFVIDHPTKPGKKLRYASLEGPENAVYVRGRLQDSIIELPEYWTGLVHSDSITVNLTPIGESAAPRVKEVANNRVIVFSKEEGELDYYYTVYAERKDVEKLEVEI